MTADQGSFTLRKAEESDAGRIRKLVRSNRINPSGLKWPRFIVIEDSAGLIIACGQLKPHFDQSVELASIVVDGPYRGQGLARRVIEHLISLHPGELYLVCRAELRPFYQKFGFQNLTNEQMPAYFRRIKRLVGIVESTFNQDLMAVMGRALPDGPQR